MTQLTTNDSLPAYTLGYAPPEQITGKQTDARSDLYALGVTLYHLLTGEAADNANTPSGTVLLHTSLDNLQSFTNPVSGIGGISNQLEEQDFVPAQVGNGALFKKEGQVATFTIERDHTQNINLDRGEIEFWYRPNHVASTHTGQQHTLFRMAIDGYNPPALQLTSGNEVIFSVSGGWKLDKTTNPLWIYVGAQTPDGHFIADGVIDEFIIREMP